MLHSASYVTKKRLNSDLIISVSFFQALDGFVIVLTRDFEVFYASETVQDYLGLAQVNLVL